MIILAGGLVALVVVICLMVAGLTRAKRDAGDDETY